MESCPAQAVLPLVGPAADQLIRDRHGISWLRNFASGLLQPLAWHVTSAAVLV
ncbi:MAG: hypothetical protein R6U98_03770 [Pirellulaceae bacterium]